MQQEKGTMVINQILNMDNFANISRQLVDLYFVFSRLKQWKSNFCRSYDVLKCEFPKSRLI